MTDINKEKLEAYISSVDTMLEELISVDESNYMQKNVLEAMKYSLSAGGKRVRPVLLMEFCRVCGGNVNASLIPACALEMIHTFSLIHDDLPCMDNDDYRRGKPSCHKAYGEAVALLAGDALENLAFGIIADNEKTSPSIAIKLISELSYRVGTDGMIGGQVIDIEQYAKDNEEILLNMYSKKTSALLKAACRMGCITAGASDIELNYAENFAEKLGLAFQIIDDILDVTSTTEELGKPVGSDAVQNKTTYVTVTGIKHASKKAEILTNEALLILDNFNGSGFLKDFTKSLLIRNK